MNWTKKTVGALRINVEIFGTYEIRHRWYDNSGFVSVRHNGEKVHMETTLDRKEHRKLIAETRMDIEAAADA